LCLLLTTGCRYAVVGDSVASISREEFRDLGGETFANGGVDIPTGRQALRELAEEGDEPIVISLGLMDTSLHTSPDELEMRIRSVLAKDVVGVDCVIWVDLKETSNVHRHWPGRSRRFNAILQDVAAEYDRPVAHWSDRAAGHPDWFQDDGVHPNLLGQQRYAEFVSDAVDHYC
jgi:lysophospholipase L1-like esterase